MYLHDWVMSLAAAFLTDCSLLQGCCRYQHERKRSRRTVKEEEGYCGEEEEEEEKKK